MVIDGRKLAEEIKKDIRSRVEDLKMKGIHPKIAIVTVGDENTWQTYVYQKMKFADDYGIRYELIHLKDTTTDNLISTIEQLNNNNNVHGIIIQRPVPDTIDRNAVTNTINPTKDIDGFRSDSHFKPPIWLAVFSILQSIYKQENIQASFEQWLRNQTWTIVGKGETGGKPIIHELQKLGVKPLVIDSKTTNAQELTRQANIVVSSVGKRVVEGKSLKPGVILIGIGLHRDERGNLRGDYDEEDIKDVASYYTPTPGGVGPLNLAFLFQNLTEAAMIK